MSAAASDAQDGKKQKKEKKQGEARFQDDEKRDEFVRLARATPKGQLKNFSKPDVPGFYPFADNYYPEAVESAWDTYWEKEGFFKPAMQEGKEKFVIVIPPPNVTGTLHIGHALTLSVEDCLVRWHRMSGHNTLWVPGVDHAGIATQTVVEKKIKKTLNLTRHDLGRERFLEEVWKWKHANGDRIGEQVRRMGASVDWSRDTFTMDDKCSRAVTEAFVRMYNMGVIYRANRLVSWSCALRTAISDIEVNISEIAEPTMLTVPGYDKKVEVGVLHSFAYRLKGGNGEIVVSTTRIETMLGDVAVAVHSSDERYKHLVGKELEHPFVAGRRMVVITDDVLVDPKYGTGAVKITPAHDPSDFECGRRHRLLSINIFDDYGKINENGGKFAGMHRFAAREAVTEALTALGLYRGKQRNPSVMRLGICSRSGDIVEPVIRPQWWVATKEMSQRSVQAVRTGQLKIVPERFKDVWYRWLEDSRDWCVSRQLWWGHRIPAFRVLVEGAADNAKAEADKSEEDYKREWVIARSEREALEMARQRFPHVAAERVSVRQDDDVLDTWFSSGLFPFSTMGWPENTADMRLFYPNSLLETGHDILFFWVARMVMMGLTLTNQLPFHTVYLHGMVRDKTGEKMSKSKGNVIDPLDMVTGCSLEHLHNTLRNGNLDAAELERALATQKRDFPGGIAECGADALRFGLLAYTMQSRDDINLDPLRVVGYRTFCNKIWHATRFALRNFPAGFTQPDVSKMLHAGQHGFQPAFADRWILSRLQDCIESMDRALTGFEFSQATSAIYDFWLKELCDVYLEAIKPTMNDPATDAAAEERRRTSRAVLFVCLDYALRLLHPLMPFITEELYHRLPGQLPRGNGLPPSICVAEYPKPQRTASWRDREVESAMGLVDQIVHAARSFRANTLGNVHVKVPMYVSCSNAEDLAVVRRYREEIKTLSFAAEVTALELKQQPPEQCLSTVVNANCNILVPVKGVLEVDKEVLKLDKKLAASSKSLQTLQVAISVPNYDRTPDKVKAEHRSKVEELSLECKQLTETIAKYEAMMTRAQLEGYKREKLDRLGEELAAVEKTLAKNAEKLADPGTQDKAKQKLQQESERASKDKAELQALIAQTTRHLDALIAAAK